MSAQVVLLLISSRATRFLNPPANPSARMAGAFADKKLQKVADETKITAKMIDWFVKNGVDAIEKWQWCARKRRRSEPYSSSQ